MKIHILALAVTSLLLASCFHVSASNEEDMRVYGSALTKLSKAVESTVRYKSYPDEISGNELLDLATAHRPVLLEPFIDLTIKVNRIDKDSAVLICSKDGSEAYLEDAGCTGELDGNLWQSSPALACEFTLDITTICAQR